MAKWDSALLMDAFGARLALLDALRTLAAAQPSIASAAELLARNELAGHRAHLAACLAETLSAAATAVISDTNLVSHRLNIFLVVDAVLRGEAGHEYSRLWAPRLADMTRAVVPAGDPTALANLATVRKILDGWRRRSLFDDGVIDELVAVLPTSTNSVLDAAAAPDVTIEDDSAALINLDEKERSRVMRRIEDDRERHKRAREEVWLRATMLSTSDSQTSQNQEEISPGWTLPVDQEFTQMWSACAAMDSQQRQCRIDAYCRAENIRLSTALGPNAPNSK